MRCYITSRVQKIDKIKVIVNRHRMIAKRAFEMSENFAYVEVLGMRPSREKQNLPRTVPHPSLGYGFPLS